MGNNGLKLCHCGGTLFLDADRQGFIRVIDKLSEFIREDLNLKCLLVKSSRVASGAHHVASPSTSNVKKHQAKGSRENGDGRRVEGIIHTEMYLLAVTFYHYYVHGGSEQLSRLYKTSNLTKCLH